MPAPFRPTRLALPGTLLAAAAAILACAAKSPADSGDDPDTGTVPAMYQAWGNGTTVAEDGEQVVIHSNGIPDHKSPYFATSSSKYEAYNGTNASWNRNPNSIVEQALTFRIPKTPVIAATVTATPLGPIGVATNGVPIFNQYAAGRSPLAGEINGFDQYNGHPQQSGQYHYHVEPLWLTRTSRDVLIGVLLDGFPVYGPMENGKLVTSADLDALHGHTGPTREYPNGIYHYHTTSDAPYINGTGFRGTPGTVTQ